jgi:uncharacterized tellurite resistance protein B-like protein
MAELLKIAPSFYGISMIPKDTWLDYGFALLSIAGSDGEVSDPELEWLTIDLASSVGVDEEIIAKWEDFDYEDADLKEIFTEINARSFASYNKLLIYDAVRMSYADDDYAEEEREKVGEAAAILNVSRETVTAIEALVEMERATDKMRMLVF